jgi:hypothetical protein
MNDALSKKLNLRVNEYSIILNGILIESELYKYNIKKLGFFQRLIIKPSNDEIVFWAKNCDFNYIDDDYKNSIVPILHKKIGTHMMYGTSAYLWYKNDSLSKFTFQIIQNEYAAKLNLEKLEDKVKSVIGSPSSSEGSSRIWEVGKEKLVIEFPCNIQHGYVHFMVSD